MSSQRTIGETIEIFPRGALYPMLTTYEGEINGEEAFMYHFKGEDKIFSWRDKKENIKQLGQLPGALVLSTRKYTIYDPSSPEYEDKKKLMINGGNWQD